MSEFDLNELVDTPDGIGRLVYVAPDGMHAIEFPFSAQWVRYPVEQLTKLRWNHP